MEESLQAINKITPWEENRICYYYPYYTDETIQAQRNVAPRNTQPQGLRT